LVSIKALVDYLSPKEEDFIYCSIAFLKQRFQTPAVSAATELYFNEEEGSFLFDIDEHGSRSLIDPSLLMKLNQSIHITILKQKRSEKAVVLGTKNLDWRAVLHSNSIEINAEILPVDLSKSGPMGLVTLHLDLLPALTKVEALSEEAVSKQISLERKFEQESIQQFLEYANNWWAEYKQIRPSHKTRLVKIFAESDDREASVYKPVCSMVQPMQADRLLETPLHAARFVSLIPF